MNVQNFSVFLATLLFSSTAFAQSKFHENKSVPILTSSANGFAYVTQNPDGIGGSLHLAKITRTFPMIKARDVAELENYNSGLYRVYDLSSSPDNQYLVSYRIQSHYSDYIDILDPHPDIAELDILFYDMNNGEYLGYVDDIPFGYINESLHPSEELEAYRLSQLEAGVPPEVVAEYDYIVNNEHSFTDFFDLRWNTDGTVSLSYLYDVYLRSDFSYIGAEVFTINYEVSPSGVSLESYGNIKTAAAIPPVFSLSVDEPLPGDMRLESRKILFPEQVTLFPGLDLTLYRPKQGVLIGGGIPARYWNF